MAGLNQDRIINHNHHSNCCIYFSGKCLQRGKTLKDYTTMDYSPIDYYPPEGVDGHMFVATLNIGTLAISSLYPVSHTLFYFFKCQFVFFCRIILNQQQGTISSFFCMDDSNQLPSPVCTRGEQDLTLS